MKSLIPKPLSLCQPKIVVQAGKPMTAKETG